MEFQVKSPFRTVSVWLLGAARHWAIRYQQAADREVVLFQPAATCLRPSPAGCLSEPVATAIRRGCFVCVELPLSGTFVHGQPSLFLLALLSSLIWPTSRPATQCATVASQDLQCGGSGRQFKDSSSLKKIVVSRGCNCAFHLQRLTKASGMRRELDERGIPNKWVVNKKTGSFRSSRFPRAGINSAFMQMKRFSAINRKSLRRPSWMQSPGKFVQKTAFL